MENDSDQYFIQPEQNNCKICDTNFATHAELVAHAAYHFTPTITLQEAAYACTKCPRQFKEKKHIRHHIQSHIISKNNEFPGKCYFVIFLSTFKGSMVFLTFFTIKNLVTLQKWDILTKSANAAVCTSRPYLTPTRKNVKN